MARRRRSVKRSRERKDWVYRGVEFDTLGAVLASQVASYTTVSRNAGAYTLQVGSPLGLILYDSVDYLKTMTAAGVRMTALGSEARAEGRKPTIHAVEVEIHAMPNAWTAGSNFAIGMRLVICDQNMLTGALDLPASYGIMAAPSAMVSPSMWANGWGNLAERVDRIAFSTGNEQQRWRFRMRWKGRRTLQANTCLGLYIESAAPALGETTLLITPRCRSLVSDPNS